ncbi:MAG TPA: aspartate-semialdehyde dehydrogenase [Chromobacteriaceae bacterium]|nr:aspartate-semialdehyde dehydrogenase [Chromobacteriaceae bacterium]
MSHSIQLAVVGATSLVGQAILDLLAERQLPLARVFAVDGAEHDGATVSYGNLELDVHPIDDFNFENVGLAIFAAGSELARQYVPQARAAGASVVDFSAAFRQSDAVPLVIPAINGEQLQELAEAALVAAPNCTVTPLALALQPLLPLGLERLTVSTYQSVSGMGQAAMEELAEQTTSLFSQRDAEPTLFPKRIAFNLLPQVGELDENGVAEEEQSVRAELRRLFDLPQLPIEATCVRVPVFFGHAWSVSVKLSQNVDLQQIRQRLLAAGLQVVSNQDHGGYITPMEATGNNGIWISRLRYNDDVLCFWLSADNVRVGAALNCVLLAEALLQQATQVK